MYAQVGGSKENSSSTKRQESKAVANYITQKKSKERQGLGFVDNRPGAIAQRGLIDVIQSMPMSVVQLKRFKYVEEAGRRHYGDGWGALYHIQNDSSLKAEVQNDQLGNWTRDLGRYYHSEEDVERPCTVGYRNRNRPTTRKGEEVNDTITSIYHCGPSSQ